MEAVYVWIVDQVQNNQFFAGVAGASIIAPILYYLRGLPGTLLGFLIQQSTVELLVTNDDAAFETINEWMSRLHYAKRVRRLRLTTWVDEHQESWTLAPGVGNHLFMHKGRPVLVKRVLEPSEKSTTSFRVRENFTIRTLGRDQGFMRRLIQDAHDVNKGLEAIKVYIWADGYWDLVGWKLKRSPHTVVLKPGQLERIVDDMRWFMGAKDWYRDRGIPYRRGYLLSGEPGTGKSSLVSALAGVFGMPIYTMNLSTVRNDNALLSAFSRVPSHAILLIEDVDATATPVTGGQIRKAPVVPQPAQNGGEPKEEKQGVSLSGFLNAIDGVASAEGRLLVMTTNFPERLDRALVRPGRVDLHEELRLAGLDEARRMFDYFYGDNPWARDARAKLVLSRPVPPAVLQQHYMRFQNPAEAALSLDLEVHRALISAGGV